MFTKKNLKEYEVPKLECIRQDESNKVFFTASFSQAVTTASVSINSMTTTSGSW